MQTKGLQRNTIDKFYTKKSTVKICMNLITQFLNISREDLVIEPSAGNGAFISSLKKISDNFLFIDISPEHEEIRQEDFLLYDIPPASKIHVIGNPPFGRQSSMAIKFIRKACKFANSISFILPASFKKDSLKSKIPKCFHLLCEEDLPKNSFSVDKVDHDVPCVFQIWKKKKYNRPDVEKLFPIGFKFVKQSETPDISFRRVGVNAGTISSETENKSSQSHYFICFTKPFDFIQSLNEIKWDINNTVGPKSISKQELILQFNKILMQT